MRRSCFGPTALACLTFFVSLSSFAGTAEGAPERRTLLSGGAEREYFVQIPSTSKFPRPVVIVLHGGTRPASDIFQRSAWSDVAAREGFILVAPQGLNNQWNDGRRQTVSGKVSTADDVAFLEQLIAQLVSQDRADPTRIYMSGASNGGLMTFRFSCERAGLLAGIGPTISKMPLALRDGCKPSKALPVIMIAGTADPLMPFDGAPSGPLGRRPQDPMTSVPETLTFWAQINGCTLPAREQGLEDVDASDGSTVTLLVGQDCRLARLSLYRVNGGGHREPTLSRGERSSDGAITRMLGSQNHDVEAAEVIWSFFDNRSAIGSQRTERRSDCGPKAVDCNRPIAGRIRARIDAVGSHRRE